MSTSSKKKTQKKNDTIGNKDNNVAKVNTTGYAPLREQTVAGHMGVSKSIAAKNKTERLKKEAAGGYKSVPLSKKPVGVAFREIFNKPPKLKQKKKKRKEIMHCINQPPKKMSGKKPKKKKMVKKGKK